MRNGLQKSDEGLRKKSGKKAETAADRCYFLHSDMPCCDLRGFLCHAWDFRANGAGDLLRT